MSNVGFVSTGDAVKDQEIANQFHKHDRRIAEGMCSNGCGPMNRTDTDGYDAQCPKCYFCAGGNTPRFAGLPFAEWKERPSQKESQ